ncbi:MAG: sigma-70 family RNA polymerase sigma factor [Actinomycetota bacterium]|nr:sigma-70 family RNA polymerase sigma factor [Actinomycetota bacterium]
MPGGAGHRHQRVTTPAVPFVSRAELSDEALMASVGHGCHDAMSEVYRRHHRAVSASAAKVLGDGLAGHDVAQDVFIGLWTRPGRFDPSRGTLRGYLMTVTHSRAVDVLRSEAARRRREALDNPGDGGLSSKDDVSVDVDRRREADKVRAVLSDLPPGQRQAIVLAFYGGHSYREVARLLAVPEGTVKGRIRTGLQAWATPCRLWPHGRRRERGRRRAGRQLGASGCGPMDQPSPQCAIRPAAGITETRSNHAQRPTSRRARRWSSASVGRGASCGRAEHPSVFAAVVVGCWTTTSGPPGRWRRIFGIGGPRPVAPRRTIRQPASSGNTGSCYRRRTLAGGPLDDSVVGAGSWCDDRVDAMALTTTAATVGVDLSTRSEQTSPAGGPWHRRWFLAGQEDFAPGVLACPGRAIQLRSQRSRREQQVAARDELVAARGVSRDGPFAEPPNASASRSPRRCR